MQRQIPLPTLNLSDFDASPAFYRAAPGFELVSDPTALYLQRTGKGPEPFALEATRDDGREFSLSAADGRPPGFGQYAGCRPL